MASMPPGQPAVGGLLQSAEQIDELLRVASGPEIGRVSSVEANRLVRNHFNNLTFFRYDNVIGKGTFGVAHAITQKRFPKRARKLVVKRAASVSDQEELRNEIRAMSKLNGSAHIASVIAAKLHDVWGEERPGIFKRLVSRIRRRKENILRGLPGPGLVLEHIEHGTLSNFLLTIARNNRVLPNRVLWKLYLCLLKACVAMKFAPKKPYGAQPQLEEIPEDQSNPSSIIHDDLHGGNILIGAAGDFPEHALVPPLKLIDFGLSFTNDELCEPRNLFDVSVQIYYLIIRRFDIIHRYDTHRGIRTLAVRIVPQIGQPEYQWLDNDLRELIIRCLALEAENRPSLSEALNICKNAVETKTPGYYGFYSTRETDYAIRVILQDVLYDAPE